MRHTFRLFKMMDIINCFFKQDELRVLLHFTFKFPNLITRALCVNIIVSHLTKTISCLINNYMSINYSVGVISTARPQGPCANFNTTCMCGDVLTIFFYISI